MLDFDCKWCLYRWKYGDYVKAYRIGSGRGSNKVSLHRFLTECPDGYVVDHINGNGLDNRKDNLRICTHLENMQNITKPSKGRYSKERGVSFHKPSKKWSACFEVNKTRIFVGYFKTEEEAIKAIRKARRNTKLTEVDVK